ncbi:hypothetical protein GOP47_0008103 [Adiantum capillus-veneris]|uniref:Uncharacterized protein n=1 Tax=Adiantum capillus-veneris TaxID=13818 RepID=A0A9D4UYP7_ADICA|nr:hypothetical protein GOP47_0008103 [Adiantum capillus-veneris]
MSIVLVAHDVIMMQIWSDGRRVENLAGSRSSKSCALQTLSMAMHTDAPDTDQEKLGRNSSTFATATYSNVRDIQELSYRLPLLSPKPHKSAIQHQETKSNNGSQHALQAIYEQRKGNTTNDTT